MGVLVQSKVTWGNQVYQGVPLDGQKLLIKEGKATQWAVGRVIITFSQHFLLALVFFGAFLCI